MTSKTVDSITIRQVIWLVLFSIAMGYLESAVVIYLRDIYYPGGFQFPLTPIHARDFITELGREAATLIMLVGVGLLTGKTKLQKVSFFLMAFGIWDIFYYFFLWIILGWPDGWLTWDILFLLPVPWIGPVLCPCILSITMILLAVIILYKEKKQQAFRLKGGIWFWFIGGSLIVILSFCIDPINHLSQFSPNTIHPYIPKNFDWWLFILGEIELLLGILWVARRKSALNPETNPADSG